jgi:tol-pal system protein YbgF
MVNFLGLLRGMRFAAVIASTMLVAACASNPNGTSANGAGSASTPGSAQDFVVNVGDRVFFNTDSTELTPQSRATLDKQAQWLNQYNRYSFTIEGQPAAPRQGDAFDPSAHPNAPGVPRALGSKIGQPLDMGALAGRPGNRGGPPPVNGRAPAQQQAVLPPSNSAKDEYDLAYGYILRRDYALAEQSFKVFLQNHPDGRLVPDAHYWIGESQYQRKQYNDSAETFLDVYNKYPNSLKAPEALLRLGQSLAAIGKQDAACASLGAVLTKYPKASAHVKKTVAAEQKRVRC